jgi:beta-lactamase class A
MLDPAIPVNAERWGKAMLGRMNRWLCAGLLAAILLSTGGAAPLDVAALEKDLRTITRGFDGRVGACVQDLKDTACIQGSQRFPMQSVMKLLVGVAALDAVDRKVWRLEQHVTIERRDLSLYVQPLAQLVGPAGFRTTIGDLVRRAIIASDSAATDVLIARLGGPAAAQAALERIGIAGIRLDRDERHLQTEIVGLTWRPEYVDPALLDKAIAAVPEAARARAYARYRQDIRDTATPRGMVAFLGALSRGKLLSPSSTAFVLQAMNECATFPDRLKAGAAPGWKVAHKTGTSGSWNGLTAATNDVGILTSPDGSELSIAVFVADSRASSAERAAIIASISTAAIAHDR